MRKRLKMKNLYQKNREFKFKDARKKRKSLFFKEEKNSDQFFVNFINKHKFFALYFLIFFVISGNFIASLFLYQMGENSGAVHKVTTANAASLLDNENYDDSSFWGANENVISSSSFVAKEDNIENYVSDFFPTESWGKKKVDKIEIPKSIISEPVKKVFPKINNDIFSSNNLQSPEIKVASYQPKVETTSLVSQDIKPLWRENAITVSRSLKGKKLIAIIIDDLGIDKKRTSAILDLPAPLTTSFLTYATRLTQQVNAAKNKGHEIMLHVPMEPEGKSYDPGPDVLKTSMNNQEIKNNLDVMLAKINGYVGINNHMGSKFTSDERAVGAVIDELHDKGLLFIDSMTSADSIGGNIADQKGVPSVSRNVFLDNLPGEKYALKQIKKLEDLAMLNGYAVAIGHPRDGTIQALSKWLETAYDRGFAVVPVSYVVKYRNFPSEVATK